MIFEEEGLEDHVIVLPLSLKSDKNLKVAGKVAKSPVILELSIIQVISVLRTVYPT